MGKGNKTKIIYASGSFQGQYNLCEIAQNILEAWPKIPGSKQLLEWLSNNKDSNRIALMDSGIFTTWTKGEEVDIDAYADDIHQYLEEGSWSHFVGVDRIPGSYGHIPTKEQVDSSAKETWDNFLYMVEKKKVPASRLLAVFHQNEDFCWLKNMVNYHEQMLKSGSKEGLYIGISPANDRPTSQRIMWLEQCMPYVTNSDGSAKIRFHGFGATSTQFLHRFPWFSADSTSWLKAGASGQIRIPKSSKQFPYYNSNLTVAVTFRSGSWKNHFGRLSNDEKTFVRKYVEENGISFDDVQDDTKRGVIARQTINLRYWKRLEAELNMQDNRWKKPQNTFV